MAGDPGLAVDGLSGLLYVLLAAWVARLRPKSRPAAWFSLFAAAFGLAYLTANARLFYGWTPDSILGAALMAATIGLYLVTVVGLVGLGMSSPFGKAETEPRRRAAAAFLGGSVVAAGLAFLAMEQPPDGTLAGSIAFGAAVATLAVRGGFAFALLLLALRYLGTGPGDARERREGATMSAALVLFPAMDAGSLLGTWALPENQVAFGLIPGLALAACASVWLAASRKPQGGRTARNLALLFLGVLALGFILATWLDPPGQLSGPNGVARTLGVLVLAYAIVRHKVFGLDARLRLAVRGTTLAAVFVGVFFVASEAAQQFFGARLGSQYMGIAAAGTLVFGLAPLQRMADRLAHRAVPNATGGGQADPEAAYRAAVRMAARAGPLSSRDRAELGRLADRLGVRPSVALRVSREAEAAPRRRKSGS